MYCYFSDYHTYIPRLLPSLACAVLLGQQADTKGVSASKSKDFAAWYTQAWKAQKAPAVALKVERLLPHGRTISGDHSIGDDRISRHQRVR